MNWLEQHTARIREEFRVKNQKEFEEANRRQLEEQRIRSAKIEEERKRIAEVESRLRMQLTSYNPYELLADIKQQWRVGRIVTEQYIRPKWESRMQVALIYEYPVKEGDYYSESERGGSYYVSPSVGSGGDGVVIGLDTSFDSDSFELHVRSGSSLYRADLFPSSEELGPMVHVSEVLVWGYGHAGNSVIVSQPGEGLTEIQDYLARDLVHRQESQTLPLQNEARGRKEILAMGNFLQRLIGKL